jgi:malto-oligosyltrehalose trehalohydrolase
LRFDAIDQIEDESDIHILKELALEAYAVSDRLVHLITENPANGTDLMAETEGGTRLYKADWNDDFHHALHSAVTGENTGYYEPLSADAWRNTTKALAQGHLKEGKRILGIEPPAPSALPTTCYVHFLQNHDQVGNRAIGERLHQSLDADRHAALVAMLVMSPQIPLFFQGDDHLSLRPFRFFADYEGTLRADVWKNRETEAVNFGGFPDGVGREDIPDPSDVATFEGCKQDWNEAELRDRKDWRVLLKRLFQARRDHVVPLLGPLMRGGRALACPEGCVFVDWQAPDGHLKLRANLSTDRVTIKEDTNFEIYPGNRLEDDRWLYTNSVRVFRTIN